MKMKTKTKYRGIAVVGLPGARRSAKPNSANISRMMNDLRLKADRKQNETHTALLQHSSGRRLYHVAQVTATTLLTDYPFLPPRRHAVMLVSLKPLNHSSPLVAEGTGTDNFKGQFQTFWGGYCSESFTSAPAIFHLLIKTDTTDLLSLTLSVWRGEFIYCSGESFSAQASSASESPQSCARLSLNSQSPDHCRAQALDRSENLSGFNAEGKF